MKLYPQRERLIVRTLKIDAVTKSGIHLGGKSGDKEWRIGQVLEVGPGRDREVDAAPTHIGVKRGNLIVYSPMAGRYAFHGSLLEQFGLVPEGVTVIDYSEVMFAIKPENEEERQAVDKLLSQFDETTLDDESAEDMQLREEIAAEDSLQSA